MRHSKLKLIVSIMSATKESAFSCYSITCTQNCGIIGPHTDVTSTRGPGFAAVCSLIVMAEQLHEAPNHCLQLASAQLIYTTATTASDLAPAKPKSGTLEWYVKQVLVEAPVPTQASLQCCEVCIHIIAPKDARSQHANT